MNFDEIISGAAFSLGFVQMYKSLEKSVDVDVKNKDVAIISLVASILWLIYQYRKLGANVTTVYMVLGIFVQLYILNRILLKEDNKLKDSK